MMTDLLNVTDDDTISLSPHLNLSYLKFGSDDEFAKILVDYFHGELLFLSDKKCILIWNGKFWERDSHNKAAEKLLDLRNDIILLKKFPPKSKLLSKIINVGNNNKCSQILNSIGNIAGNHKINSSDIDCNHDLINFKNVTLDLKNVTLRKQNKDDRITKMINIVYDQNKKCPLWNNFIKDTFQQNDNVIKYIKKLCGYFLTAEVSEQKFYLLYGAGANGKSVFLHIVRKILASYAWTFDSGYLTNNRNFNVDKLAQARSDLIGKHVAIADELPDKKSFNSPLIKIITGEETIQGRKLYEASCQFKNTCKLVIASNEKPFADSDDKAFYRRLVVIPFLYEVPDHKRDKLLTKKLEKELSGILNWFIDGLKLYRDDQNFVLPEDIEKATHQYRDDFDSLKEFILEACSIGAEFKIKGKIFKNAYIKWLEDNGYSCKNISSQKIYHKLSMKEFICDVGAGNAKYIYGLDLNDVSI